MEARAKAATQVANWRAEVAATFSGRPQTSQGIALQPYVSEFNLPRARFEDLVDGVEMDLHHLRYDTFADLVEYCRRVASAVGLICVEIFGYRNQAAKAYAENLGLALQLTNIIRDVGEDARRNRVYLPLDELSHFGVSATDVAHLRESDAFRRLIDFQIERAEEYYRRAFEALPAADRKAQRPGLVMAAIYRTLLREIRNGGSRVLNQRTSLTPVRKLWIAWRTWLTA